MHQSGSHAVIRAQPRSPFVHWARGGFLGEADEPQAGLADWQGRRSQCSFDPFPARTFGRALAIRATRVADVLAEPRWIT